MCREIILFFFVVFYLKDLDFMIFVINKKEIDNINEVKKLKLKRFIEYFFFLNCI